MSIISIAGTYLYADGEALKNDSSEIETVEFKQYNEPQMAVLKNDNADISVTADSKVSKDSIFYKMLNTVDYYTKVSGIVIDANGNINAPITIEFESDLEKINAYSKVTIEDLTKRNTIFSKETYISDMQCTKINNIKKTFTVSGDVIDEKQYVIPKSNERLKTSEDEQPCYSYRPNSTNIPEASSCLLPQEITFSLLTDKDMWSINGTETYLERECYIINGKTDKYYSNKLGAETFLMLVDVKTGTLLKYEGYNSGGDVCDYIYAKEIKFDGEAENVKSLSKDYLSEFSKIK